MVKILYTKHSNIFVPTESSNLANMLKSIIQSAIGCTSRHNYCTHPLLIKAPNNYIGHQNQKPRQVWIESMNNIDGQSTGLIELHPDVFAATPRIDIIQRNMLWQNHYRRVNFFEARTRAEMAGGGRKPWPQKGKPNFNLYDIRSLCNRINFLLFVHFEKKIRYGESATWFHYITNIQKWRTRSSTTIRY